MEEQQNLIDLSNETPSFERCIKLIESSIHGLELTNEFVKLPQVEKVVLYLKTLQHLFPPSYVQFVTQNFPPKAGEKFYLQLSENVTWVLNVEVITGQVPKANKKWYDIFKNKK